MAKEQHKPHPFSIGDIVRLKSGGPQMTVTDIATEQDPFDHFTLGRKDPRDTYCDWFVGQKHQTARFISTALELVSEASSNP